MAGVVIGYGLALRLLRLRESPKSLIVNGLGPPGFHKSLIYNNLWNCRKSLIVNDLGNFCKSLVINGLRRPGPRKVLIFKQL